MNRRHFWFGLQAAGTLVLLAVLFRRFDWALFAGVIGQISVAFYAGSLLVMVMGQVLYAYRWQVVLAATGVKVPYGEVLRQYLIGMFFSNLMPTAVGGDAAKVYYLGRREGYVEIGASVLIDRVLGFFWLSVIGAALAWLTPATDSVMVLNRNLLSLFAAIFVVALLVLAVAPVESLLRRVTPLRWAAMVERVAAFAGLVRRGALRPGTLAVSAVVVASYAWLIALVYLWFFSANALANPGVAVVMLMVVSMSIFVNVPISVNGIGLREQLHVLLFTVLGIPKEVSVSISLLLFAHTLVLGLVGWVLWLRLRPALQVPAA